MSANTWSPPTEFCPQCKRPVRVTITNRLWTHDYRGDRCVGSGVQVSPPPPMATTMAAPVVEKLPPLREVDEEEPYVIPEEWVLAKIRQEVSRQIGTRVRSAVLDFLDLKDDRVRMVVRQEIEAALDRERTARQDRSIKLHETVVCLFGDPEELPG